MSGIYLARQPIFDRSQSVIGYELLHRSGPENVFARIDSDVASSQTVDRAAMGVGLDELTDGRLAFVNVSRRVLVEEIYTLLPTPRTIIDGRPASRARIATGGREGRDARDAS